jgi:hypothetical protein
MDTQQIINQLLGKGGFYKEEIEIVEENNTPFTVLKSWEFYNIFYLSNSEQYYCDRETLESLKQCDKLIETKRGTYYCFS